MTYVEVEIDGRIHRVPAARAHGRLWFHWRGETMVVEAPNHARRGAAGQARPAGVITAPMPGKVTRVGGAKGDLVTKGQTLIVMEAMKMEYTLEADLDGRIVELNATTGAQVRLNEVLVRVEPS